MIGSNTRARFSRSNHKRCSFPLVARGYKLVPKFARSISKRTDKVLSPQSASRSRSRDLEEDSMARARPRSMIRVIAYSRASRLANLRPWPSPGDFFSRLNCVILCRFYAWFVEISRDTNERWKNWREIAETCDSSRDEISCPRLRAIARMRSRIARFHQNENQCIRPRTRNESLLKGQSRSLAFVFCLRD